MAHVRTQLRTAIVAALTGLATTGARVYAGRSLPLGVTPALAIYTWPDTPTEDSEGKCVILHALTVEVQGYFSGGTDDDLDQIAVEVEGAMYTDQTFGGLAQWVELGPQDAARGADGEKIEGVILMQYSVGYLAQEGAPEAAL